MVSAEGEVVRALQEWAKYAQVTFSPTTGARVRTIAVEFVTGDHGDGFPFTSTTQLAHTFYPAPVNPEPIAGDMHFNDVESWDTPSGIDLFSLALHEAGHALGLGHSDNPNDVMYPYYRKVTGLSPGDIAAIQTLYAARSGVGAPSTTPLVLTAIPPPASTSFATINLSGTVSGGTGSAVVSWATGAGSSGTASGTPSWVASAVPLVVGANSITVTASDSAGNRASQTYSVTRSPGAAPQPPRNPAPPSVTIMSPVSTNVGTTASTIAVSGTASSIVGLAGITWTSSLGSGTATGLTNWNTGKIPLMIGTNTIVIYATDVIGHTAWRSLMVTRQ
jgi:hypothetical protein